MPKGTLKLIDRDREYKPKSYKIRRSGNTAVIIDVPYLFLVKNGLNVGDEVYRYMDEDNNLVFSKELILK